MPGTCSASAKRQPVAVVVLLCGTVAAGCGAASSRRRPEGPARLITVRYSHMPGAHKVFREDGSYSAGHLLAASRGPSVHHEEGRADVVDFSRIWAAAQAIDWEFVARTHAQADTSRAHMVLEAIFSGGQSFRISWPAEGVPNDELLRALVRLIGTRRYGDW